MLGNPNTSQGERSLEDTEKRESRGGGWEEETQVALGEWQAQGLGGSAGGLEAGVGTQRSPEQTVVRDNTGDLQERGHRGDGNMCLGQPCLRLLLLGCVSPASSAPVPRPQVPAGSPALSSLGSRRDSSAARAQLWTLGGLEDLRGFPRGALASSLLPAGGLRCARPLLGLRAAPADWPRGMAQLPGPSFQAKRG